VDDLAPLLHDLRAMPHVMVIGEARRRVPALAFMVDGVKAHEVVEHLAAVGVCAFADPGHHGVLSALGIGEEGGAVRIGLAHYTHAAELDQLLHAVASLH
jgi:selenocysteine lyase/cysteine desulfurase